MRDKVRQSTQWGRKSRFDAKNSRNEAERAFDCHHLAPVK